MTGDPNEGLTVVCVNVENNEFVDTVENKVGRNEHGQKWAPRLGPVFAERVTI